tara:strand:+ start:618 stop:752 length:135 start_codon:yes stop_codon:yes gene_type:complete
MPGKMHRSEEIIGELREAKVVLRQGAKTVEIVAREQSDLPAVTN